MDYKILESLNSNDLVNLYNEILEEPVQFSNYKFYIYRVECLTGVTLSGKSICTATMDHMAGQNNFYVFWDYRFTCYEIGCGGWYGQGCYFRSGYYNGTC